ncbi:MAG: mannonate dehydratase [Spirochaetales bacterium]|nr:mannonate dehydratase [Spirochaetales bacterium]
MHMGFRWFGTGFDKIPLGYIRQIPGIEGVVTTLYDKQAGDTWEPERIQTLKDEVGRHGLKILAIESVNIHDSIKVGSPDRDQYIDNYLKTIAMLAEQDIGLICYNFMPVFDWTRSDLAKVRSDGATVFSYDQELIDQVDPAEMFSKMDGSANGYLLPGWEPARMARIKDLFAMYEPVDQEGLFNNLEYFLKAVIPVCEEKGLKMAIHPDDPAWPVFGLPRIASTKANLLRIINMVDSPANGVTVCTGSLGSNPENDIPGIIRSLKGRINFAHVRNVKHHGPGKFDEAAHLSTDGSLDMFEIMKALYETGFNGVVRPDHGRDIWGEKGMPGYGLYDRALGIAYLNGLWEALSKGVGK